MTESRRTTPQTGSTRVDSQHITGRIGISIASEALQRLGWGPVENSPEDFGTDLLIDVRDSRLFARDDLVGAQVKGGESYFRRRGEQDGVPGWWYTEPNTTHFDSWVRHSLPHLVVLVDEDTRTSYWQHVTSDRVRSTGNGAKIFVPSSQVIDESNLDALLSVAASRSTLPPRIVAPGRRLQLALIAPTAVLPRRDQLPSTASAEEYIAALLSANPLMTLEPWRPPRKPTWMSKLAAAVEEWITTDVEPSFDELAATSRRHSCTAAALVLHTAHLRDLEHHSEAIDALTPAITSDRLDPADHAWLLLQRARSHLELAQFEAARADALAAVQAIGVPHAGDQAEMAIAQAATWMLWQFASFTEEPPVRLTQAADAVAGWRDRLMFDASREALSDAWRDWVGTRQIVLASNDQGARSFYFAELNADLAADHAAWQQAVVLRSKALLMRRATSSEDWRLLIDMLRRGGDRQAVQGTVLRLLRTGPIAPLVDLVRREVPTRWSRTSAQATVALLHVAGPHFLESDEIDRTIAEVCDTLESPATSHVLNVVLSDDRWRLLGSLLRFHDGAHGHARVAEALRTVPDRHRQAAAVAAEWLNLDLAGRALQTGAGQQCDDSASTRTRDLALYESAQSSDDDLATALLQALARAGNGDAVSTLLARANAGDFKALDALTGLSDASTLTEVAGSGVVRRFASAVENDVTNARAGAFGMGGVDAGRALVITNLRFPDLAEWEPVVSLLQEPEVASNHKVGALRLIVDRVADVPQDVVDTLVNGPLPAGSKIFDDNIDGVAAGAIAALRLVAAGSADDEAAGARLLRGVPGEQRDLARLVGAGRAATLRPSLVTLLTSDVAEVVREAALAVGRLARHDPGSELLDDLVGMVTVNDRTVAPLWYLTGLGQEADLPLSESRRAATHGLASHPSRVIRRSLSRVSSKEL